MHDKMFTMSVFSAYEERAVTGFLTVFFYRDRPQHEHSKALYLCETLYELYLNNLTTLQPKLVLG